MIFSNVIVDLVFEAYIVVFAKRNVCWFFLDHVFLVSYALWCISKQKSKVGISKFLFFV